MDTVIQFTVSAKTELTVDEIVAGMFDEANWRAFKKSGLVPGIQDVQIEGSAQSVVGTVFKVKNSDGSHHKETITEYTSSHSLTMRLDEFSSPLNKFASHFREIWTFNRQKGYTHFERTFELYPRNFFGSVFLRIIGYFFKKAVEDHTQIIANEKSSGNDDSIPDQRGSSG
jgi:hypothetical protein